MHTALPKNTRAIGREHRSATHWRRAVCLIGIWLMPAAAALAQEPIVADVLLTSARILDGSGGPATSGDIAIQGDRIVAVGRFEVESAGWTIDCSGLTIAPGFIDLHNHSDNYVVKAETCSAMNFLTQGCTTLVTGNCGAGPIDVARYAERIERVGVGPNIAHLLPQGNLRSEVVGPEQREATPAELSRMCELADKAMEDGAWGMSTGLIYVPGSFASTEEITRIARVVGQHGGIYASHIRNEGTQLLASVDEAIRIGRGGGLPVHISHFKSSGQDAWGLIREAVRMIEKARSEGLVVTADQYPYIASSTSLRATIVPQWARSGGKRALAERLCDPKVSPRVREGIAASLKKRDNGARIQIARFLKRPAWAGLRLSEIAKQEDWTPLEAAVYILTNGGASIVNFSMQEEDVRHAMQVPWVATASDGRAYVPAGDRPHPRNYGTFPRKVGYYAIAEGVLTETQAIRSATSLPAEILGMTDRGVVAVGMVADLMVYDPQTIRDRATFENPHQHSAGIRHVFVNGVAAVHDGTPTGHRPGRFLKHDSAID